MRDEFGYTLAWLHLWAQIMRAAFMGVGGAVSVYWSKGLLVCQVQYAVSHIDRGFRGSNVVYRVTGGHGEDTQKVIRAPHVVMRSTGL